MCLHMIIWGKLSFCDLIKLKIHHFKLLKQHCLLLWLQLHFSWWWLPCLFLQDRFLSQAPACHTWEYCTALLYLINNQLGIPTLNLSLILLQPAPRLCVSVNSTTIHMDVKMGNLNHLFFLTLHRTDKDWSSPLSMAGVHSHFSRPTAGFIAQVIPSHPDFHRSHSNYSSCHQFCLSIYSLHNSQSDNSTVDI